MCLGSSSSAPASVVSGAVSSPGIINLQPPNLFSPVPFSLYFLPLSALSIRSITDAMYRLPSLPCSSCVACHSEGATFLLKADPTIIHVSPLLIKTPQAHLLFNSPLSTPLVSTHTTSSSFLSPPQQLPVLPLLIFRPPLPWELILFLQDTQGALVCVPTTPRVYSCCEQNSTPPPAKQ